MSDTSLHEILMVGDTWHKQADREIESLRQQLAEANNERAWIRRKLKLPEDTKLLSGEVTLAGTMHNVCNGNHGYRAYIESEKCDDKAGKIARLTVQLAECQAESAKVRAWVAKNCQHHDSCDVLFLDDEGKHSPCSCGLYEVFSNPHDATALNELIAERTASLTAEVERLKEFGPAGLWKQRCSDKDETIERQRCNLLDLRQQNAELTAAVERLNERQDFAPDQWWVKELESIETTLRPLTHDQYRAVRIAVTAVKVSMHDNEELRKQNAELTAQRDAAMKLLQEVFQEPDAIWAMGDGWKERLDAAIANGKEGS